MAPVRLCRLSDNTDGRPERGSFVINLYLWNQFTSSFINYGKFSIRK